MLFVDGLYINELVFFFKYDVLIFVKVSNSIIVFIVILCEFCDCCEVNEG